MHTMIADKDLLSIQQARILVEGAREAQRKLAEFPQEKLDAAVECVARKLSLHTRELAFMSHEETGYGNPHDKEFKNRFVCERLPQALREMRCVGILSEDPGRGTMDIGVPAGVIVALCPVTSPVSGSIYKTLLAIKSGNAIIFSPHPCAEKSMARTLDILITTAASCGLPDGSVSYLRTVTKSGTLELMRHTATSLLLITGVPGMFGAASRTGKPVIYGGTGNGPAFIERSADLRQAADDIVQSKTFDNGITPSAEQSVVVDAPVAEAFRRALLERGAHYMTEDESLKLATFFFGPDGRRKKGVIGLPAPRLARRAGFSVPADTTVLVAERRCVTDADPFSREMLSPVLAWYVEDDWRHACEKCLELLLYGKNTHTMSIHSRDEEVIRLFALKKPVGRLLVNTPAALGGMGVSTHLFPAMTLGGGASGFGITPDNVSPLNLIHVRKVGYGIGRVADLRTPPPPREHDVPESKHAEKLRALQQVLLEAARVLNDPGRV